MLNSLSYLFVHSFHEQCVFLKGCAGQQGQKMLLCFVLDFAPSEGRQRWCYLLRASLEALLDKLWQVQGGAGREPAAGVRISEKAESTDRGDRKLSETVRGSLLQSTVRTAGWRTRSEGRMGTVDRGEICFQTVKLCSPEIFLFSIVMVTLSYPVT